MILTADKVAESLFNFEDSTDFSADQLTRVNATLPLVDAVVFAYLGRSIAFSSRLETFDYRMHSEARYLPQEILYPIKDVIYLKHTPVDATTVVVTVDGVELAEGTDYEIGDVVSGVSWSGLIRKLYGTWERATVAYDGGVSSLFTPDMQSLLELGSLVIFRAIYARSLSFASFMDGGGKIVKEEDIGKWRVKYDTNTPSEVMFGASKDPTDLVPSEAACYLQPLIDYGALL